MGNSLPRIDSSARDLTGSRSSPSACKQRGRPGGCCMSVSCATCLSRRRLLRVPAGEPRVGLAVLPRRVLAPAPGKGVGHRRLMPKVIAAILLLQSGGVDSSQPPIVTAVRVDRAPVVDGRLDDPEWSLAPAVTDFRQTDPDEGAPVSEATAVRVLYDGTAVYVGARLFDSAPARIVRRLARRDASTHSDEFRVFLGSYHDRRTAFEFIVNAAGVKKDVLIGDDGDFDDASWDPVWEAATSVDSLGWSAEIRLPLSQLRFWKAQDQVWGAHFVRWIERKQEHALFPFIGKKENGLVSRFADLEGIRHVGSPKRLELLPYGVGRGTYRTPRDPGNPFERPASYDPGAGADLKYGMSSSLTLDATLNPDFGQVEGDETFVNLTAFEP